MAKNIVVPELGESVVEATVARWLKQEGDVVAVGDVLLELETEKVNLELGSESAGILAHIERQAGEDVKIGDLLGTIEEALARQAADPQASAETTPPAQPETPPAEAPAASVAEPTAPAKPVEPTASVEPVEPAAPSGPERSVERVRMSRRRRTIARNLIEAQHSAAMLTTFQEIDMSQLMDLRKRHKDSFKERHGASLGITSFFVKAAVDALRLFPEFNAEIQGEEILYKHYFDIGVALDSGEGLVVPVLRDADGMTFAQIEQAVKTFIEKTQAGTLGLEDLRGGCFTITNGGVFGSLLSTPILNFPQAGILGLHKIEDRPIAREGQVVIHPMMYAALSYDHRLIDGRQAVQFLRAIKELIEDPAALVIES